MLIEPRIRHTSRRDLPISGAVQPPPDFVPSSVPDYVSAGNQMGRCVATSSPQSRIATSGPRGAVPRCRVLGRTRSVRPPLDAARTERGGVERLPNAAASRAEFGLVAGYPREAAGAAGRKSLGCAQMPRGARRRLRARLGSSEPVQRIEASRCHGAKRHPAGRLTRRARSVPRTTEWTNDPRPFLGAPRYLGPDPVAARNVIHARS